MLAGHGGTLRELAASGWRDWLRSAEEALDGLQARVGRRSGRDLRLLDGRPAGAAARAAVPGADLGAGRDVDAAAPAPLPGARASGRWRGCRSTFARTRRAAVPKLAGSDISDDDLRYENPGLRAFPIAALEALLDLMDTVRADLPAIRTPALVVHGRQDHTVPMEDSLELTGCLGSEVIERLWLDKSFHIVTLDVERDTVIDGVDPLPRPQHAGWPSAA